MSRQRSRFLYAGQLFSCKIAFNYKLLGQLDGQSVMWHLINWIFKIRVFVIYRSVSRCWALWRGGFQTHMESPENICKVTHRQLQDDIVESRYVSADTCFQNAKLEIMLLDTSLRCLLDVYGYIFLFPHLVIMLSDMNI